MPDGLLVILDFLSCTIVNAEPDRARSAEGMATFGLAFNAQGDLLAAGTRGTLEILNGRTGATLRNRERNLPGGDFSTLTWSPRGDFIACYSLPPGGVGTGKAGGVELLDADSLATVRRLDAGRATSMSFTPDGTTIYIGSVDGTVRSFTVATGEPTHSWAAHDQQVKYLAVNPDGTRLATGSINEGEIVVWNISTPPPFDRVARFHEDDLVCGMAWNAAGNRLLGAFSGTIRVWDAIPLRERVQARDARRQILTQVEPMVARLFDELKDPAKVVERINADTTLSPLAKRTALQLVLRTTSSR